MQKEKLNAYYQFFQRLAKDERLTLNGLAEKYDLGRGFVSSVYRMKDVLDRVPHPKTLGRVEKNVQIEIDDSDLNNIKYNKKNDNKRVSENNKESNKNDSIVNRELNESGNVERNFESWENEYNNLLVNENNELKKEIFRLKKEIEILRNKVSR